jgi:UDP-4-amino-4,6-dideoxy-N-acetyl-beta-L-altrosamine transaminase
MAFIPYSRQCIDKNDIAAVCDALESDFVTQGPAIPAFEQAFAARHGVSYAVAVNNATAGLHIGCLALGVGPGSLVWTSPNSFIASANCALYCNADVDFVDIDARTRNMSVAALKTKLQLAETSGRLPQVLIPVDFSGLPCDLREMRELAEDASHAAGATYLGKPVGSAFAHASVFSFHAVKIVTTAEGGMVTTQDGELARRLQLLRSHGITRDEAAMQRESEGGWYYEQCLLGFNYRLTDVQAALGSSQLKRLEFMQGRREALADRYDALLGALPLLLPFRSGDRRSSWHLYAIEIDETRTARTRAEVYQRLRAAGVGVNVHYIPIHTQPFYERRGFKRGDFPASERYYGRAISIPLFPALTDEQQSFVAHALADAFS